MKPTILQPDWLEFAQTFVFQFTVPRPEGTSEERAFEIHRCDQLDGSVKWKVQSSRAVLGKSGRWYSEPTPSSRTDSFLKQFRYDTKELAYESLQKWLAKKESFGWTDKEWK